MLADKTELVKAISQQEAQLETLRQKVDTFRHQIEKLKEQPNPTKKRSSPYSFNLQ